MNPDRINWLNIGLMVLACSAALATPFKVFLLAYAILGPLHYLTEISWLHDRKYFAPSPALRRDWLAIVLAAMVAVTLGYVSTEVLHRPVSPTLEMFLVIVAFIAAAGAVFAKHRVSAVAFTLSGAAAAGLFLQYSQFAIAAYLLVTMVHVLLFTGCFILFGAIKSRSTSGYLSFAAFCACSAGTMIVFSATAPALAVQSNYAAFAQLNQVLLEVSGSPGAALYGVTGRRVMQLIAFAYSYHYLNWFSKTSVIRWHEVSKRRASIIVVFWAGSLLMYAYDYRLGFSILYVLSVLHVLLEFPLNHYTVAGIVRALRPMPAPRRLARGGALQVNLDAS